MTKALFALDQGTSSTRAFAYGLDGQVLAVAQKPLQVSTPHPGWVEQSPEQIIKDTHQVLSELAVQAKLDPVALGITNQRETTIVWDAKTHEAIYPAIVWQDRRTLQACQALSSHRAIIQQKTGLVLDPYFSALKIAWILDNVPGARKKAEQGELKFGTVDSFVLWHLTKGKEHATDMTNASRTMLFNLHTLDWDDELCELLRVPRQMLPQIKPSDALFGHANKLDLPISAMIGDQQSASLGQGCLQPGSLKSTYGTGCFMLLNTGDKVAYSDHQLISTVALSAQSKVTYALEGSLFTAGALMRWLRDKLGHIEDVRDTDPLARAVGLDHQVYMIPALSGLGAPIWDASAKAAIFGLGLDSDARHIIAASLEALCFQSKLLIDTFQKDTGKPVSQCYIDGGMSANNWFCELLSNAIPAIIERPQNIETTSSGAAFLAGVSQGIFDLDAVGQFKTIQASFEPSEHVQIMQDKYQSWLDLLAKTSTFKASNNPIDVKSQTL